MRLLFALLLLSAAPAFADSFDAPVASSPANVPGLYQKLTPPPTAVPTPLPGNTISATVVEMHQDTMSLAIEGGAALPLGDMAKYNTAGYSVGLDLIYGASAIVDGAFFMSYASMPYSLTTAAQPQTSTGLGVKAIIKVLHDQKLSINVDGGIGYYFVNVATNPQIGIDPKTQLPILGTVYQTQGGVGFDLGLEAALHFTPKFAASLKVEAVQVSLDGGTGTTSQYVMPSVGITYTF